MINLRPVRGLYPGGRNEGTDPLRDTYGELTMCAAERPGIPQWTPPDAQSDAGRRLLERAEQPPVAFNGLGPPDLTKG